MAKLECGLVSLWGSFGDTCVRFRNGQPNGTYRGDARTMGLVLQAPQPRVNCFMNVVDLFPFHVSILTDPGYLKMISNVSRPQTANPTFFLSNTLTIPG